MTILGIARFVVTEPGRTYTDSGSSLSFFIPRWFRYLYGHGLPLTNAILFMCIFYIGCKKTCKAGVMLDGTPLFHPRELTCKFLVDRGAAQFNGHHNFDVFFTISLAFVDATVYTSAQ